MHDRQWVKAWEKGGPTCFVDWDRGKSFVAKGGGGGVRAPARADVQRHRQSSTPGSFSSFFFSTFIILG